MRLSEKFSSEFSRNARIHGEEYRREGRVRAGAKAISGVMAVVRGSKSYSVEIDWEAEQLIVRCECPYFSDNALPCKHIWAAMLEAEERGLLEGAAGVTLLAAYGEDLDLDLDVPIFASTPRAIRARISPKAPAPPRPPEWKRQIAAILEARADSRPGFHWPSTREILYVVENAQSRQSRDVVLSLLTRERKKNGEWSATKPLTLKGGEITGLPLSEDRQIVSTLSGGQQYYQYSYGDYSSVPQSTLLRPDSALSLLPAIAATGRGFLRFEMEDPLEKWASLSWEDGEPWTFELQITPAPGKDAWLLGGVLQRDEERLEPNAATLLVSTILFRGGTAARLDVRDAWDWIAALRTKDKIRIPRAQENEFVEHLLTRADLPRISLPHELTYEMVDGKPLPCLSISAKRDFGGRESLQADLSFNYGERIFAEDEASRGFCDATARRFLARDRVAERQASELLDQLGAKRRAPGYWDSGTPKREFSPKKLPGVVRELVGAGWQVTADGAIFRKPAAFRIEVSSGVDWFELHADVQYEGASAGLPELLSALKRGEHMVRLGDGTFGILPEEWLQKMGPLAGMGESSDGHFRFRRAQAGLLDALLAAQPEARCDETFARVREHWRSFNGVKPAPQPAGFAGHLRDYQAEGLGWMHFLRQFGFGGCLADDMGVGKTAQVLALLESRRERRIAGELSAPSLVVVPRSLVFNWKEEAARFTPALRVLDFTAPSRGNAEFAGYDLVLTTYGTLRRDIAQIKDIEFDTIVLDEAQAVKNADTVSSKAVRLLRGQHRLALSGTPVENHLGELWTLFEFLNPGMLGSSGAFRGADGSMRNPGEETRRMLAHALRPFILRRTKEQVIRELPPKTEQTIYCELKPVQRKLYDELRQHYRRSLLGSGSKWEKTKLQVLEALLRLRQAACHPGLLDASRTKEPSAKLDVLWDQVREVIEEGHKALVFSQFTSLLKIVRDRLDGEAISYEYLDGATRDRKARVERFQTDDGCRLFLVSLKAGGLGLNLTAADYVFILDPWWNPAAEMQAVDRAHRIGQQHPVFAYRLIARDTVEEKVLELQKSKRNLADAIIGADNSLIRDLKAEDLAMLLS